MERNDHIYTRGFMYRLIPSFQKQVKPGDRTQVNIRGTIETDVVAALRSPAVISHYLFYVPHRLVWTGWEEFIANADTVATVPVVNSSTSPFGELGETLNVNISALYRRAFKLAYNEFFGDQKFASAYYAAPFTDTAQNVVLPLKSVNQLLSAVALDLDEPADNYSVVANTIEVTEFRRRLRQNARQNNQRIGGEKYVDALRRYGVDMREEFSSRPELLLRKSEVVYPQEVFNMSETGTGARVGRYRVAIDISSRRFFSMEHGYIFACHSVRPFLARNITPLERFQTARHFWMEEMEKQYREVVSSQLGTTLDVEPDPLVPADRIFDLGDMQQVNGATGVLNYAASGALSDLIYPTVALAPNCDVAVSCKTSVVR